LKPLRIGCVKYLNALPLIRGWPGEVNFDHPSALCQRLANGDLDVALVSSFEFLRNPLYRIVDDVSISSDGPVYSVVVAHRDEFSKIKEIEPDPASQTSINLLRCVLAELGLTPRLAENIPAGGTGSPRRVRPVAGEIPMFRGRLLIGDQAIAFRQKHAGEFQFWDLGEQWKNFAGLPFAYALWLIRPEVADAQSIAQRLRDLRDKNLASLDELIGEAVAGSSYSGSPIEVDREFLARYYRKHLRFSFGEREKQGLTAFANLCVKVGVTPKRDWRFSVI
jgi:chorismate dehydratase